MCIKSYKMEGNNLSTVNGNVDNNEKFVLLELGVGEDGYEFASDIKTALSNAEEELTDITFKLEESMESLKMLTTDCDKSDYILAACSGAICGILDIFLVGKPGESPIGDVTDKWFENRTMDFAKMCGWNDKENNTLSSAIEHLEKKFKIPYDQRGAGDAASWIFDLNPKNHHFKSLGHNPTLLGLFFSILDQFCNTSHFVSNGELISLQEADGKFELKGNDVPSKLFCGFANWFGHIISDISGSSGTKGRGISRIIDENAKLNDAISNIATLGLDYSKMTEAQQYELGAYVNLMNASTQLLINPIKDLSPKFSMTDLDGFMAWKDRKTDKSIYEDNKDFIVSLANLLYKIELDDREKKLLWKSLRKNKKMLKSMDISKKEFDMDLMNGILDALRYKYIQNEKLV